MKTPHEFREQIDERFAIFPVADPVQESFAKSIDLELQLRVSPVFGDPDDVLSVSSREDACIENLFVQFKADLFVGLFRYDRLSGAILSKCFQNLFCIVREVHDHSIGLVLVAAIES